MNDGLLLEVDCSNLSKEGLLFELEEVTASMTFSNTKDINGVGLLNLSFCRVNGKSNFVVSDAEVGTLKLNSLMLTNISDNWLRRFTNLNRLELSRNDLSALTSQSFGGLSKLTELDLSLNKFIRLIQIWFEPLTSLLKLKINHCGVRYFQPSGFEWPAKLVSLSLQNNSLRFMPPLPLGTSGNKWFPWEVFLQWNDIQCYCRRKEHTEKSLNIIMFKKIYSSCLSQEYTTNWNLLDKTCLMIDRRISTLLETYVTAPLCQGPFNVVDLETTCNIDGMCSARCGSKGNPEPTLQMHKGKTTLAEFTQKKNSQVVSNFTLGSDLTKVTCEMQMSYFTVNTSLQESNRQSTADLPPTNMTATVQADQRLVLCYQKNVLAVNIILIIAVLMTAISNILLVFLLFVSCKKSSQEENSEDDTESDTI